LENEPKPISIIYQPGWSWGEGRDLFATRKDGRYFLLKSVSAITLLSTRPGLQRLFDQRIPKKSTHFDLADLSIIELCSFGNPLTREIQKKCMFTIQTR